MCYNAIQIKKMEDQETTHFQKRKRSDWKKYKILIHKKLYVKH